MNTKTRVVIAPQPGGPEALFRSLNVRGLSRAKMRYWCACALPE
jgi:hypothetical protein